ncbi:MAG: transposase [Thermodesulfobacteriota bacterium]
MKRRVYDEEGHGHFITFSCFGRRRLLDHDRPKEIVVETLADQIAKQDARCYGFVVMPDHVHALVWFPVPGRLSLFIKQWKQRSSFLIKRFFVHGLHKYAGTFDNRDPLWQRGFYDFNVYSPRVALEKLNYMHWNPVRAGLVESPAAWMFGSARFYEQGEAVGVVISTDI